MYFEREPQIENRYNHLDAGRLLTEVDHLINNRISPGIFRQDTLEHIHQNLTTSIQEQAMPYAVTETRHEVVISDNNRKIFKWMGKTAIENAMTGYNYHKHEAALRRVDIEVDEAEYSETMTNDVLRVFISPRMTIDDAPLHIAQSEHVGDDDAVRVSWLETKDGQTQRVMQSLLVRDVPYQAWVSMLEDENNIFGRSISLGDRKSALSIMKIHRQLELPKDALERGPVSIVEAIIPYISDIALRKKVITQAKKYVEKDQIMMRLDAEAKATEWLEFEKELAESLISKKATYKIKSFIKNISNNMDESAKNILINHMRGQEVIFSRELAAILESAQQKILSGRAAILNDEEFVLKQLRDENLLKQLQDNERLIVVAQNQGIDFMLMQQTQNKIFVEKNIKAGGGGCPGKNHTEFKSSDEKNVFSIDKIFSDNLSTNTDEKTEEDEFGSLDFECTKGHKNRRPRGRLIPKCTTCDEDVSCSDPEPEKQQRKSLYFPLLSKEVRIENEQLARSVK